MHPSRATNQNVGRADARTVEVRLTCQPAYTLAYCFLAAGESVLAESGAMAAMSAGVSVGAGVGPGGLVKAVARKQLGGESFFMARYTGEVHGAWVAFAPRFPGDIAQHHISTDTALLVQSGSLLAVSPDLDVDVKWAGMKAIALHEGSTILKVSGEGEALLAAYGGFQRFDLGDGEQMVVDSGHLVAFGANIEYHVGPLGGLRVAAMSGEGLVAKLVGPGPVYIQTRAEQGLVNWMNPKRSQNSG